MPTNYVINSSNLIIQDALKALSKRQFPKERIIGSNNRYKNDFLIRTNSASLLPSNINTSQISQYIASSIFSHCYDGWNFLSRGVDALFSGDIPTTIHLVYYSELRAVMSIMAFEGIGIFNKNHVYFNASKSAHTFRSSTHNAANDLINEWASLNTKKDIIFRSILVNNRSLTEWINASGHSATTGYATSVVNDWFKSWSIDLDLKNDQDLRNEMSYRPHFDVKQVNINQKVNQILQIWKGLEPMDSNRFVELDMHLLRISLEKLFKLSTGRTRRHKSYKTFVNHIFDSLGESKTQGLYSFIMRFHSPKDHILISEARKDKKNLKANCSDPVPMICRSILLLRFATSCTSLILTDSGVNHSSLKFWWEQFAFKDGITNSNPSGISPIDLYTDVSDSVSSLENYSDELVNVKECNSLALPDLCSLKQFQRICFWGMGL